MPWKDKTKKRIFHFNRTVIHPDYQGFGLGLKLINGTSNIVKNKYGYDIRAKFSSIPLYKSCLKDDKWKLMSYHQIKKKNKFKASTGSLSRENTLRNKVITYEFKYIG